MKLKLELVQIKLNQLSGIPLNYTNVSRRSSRINFAIAHPRLYFLCRRIETTSKREQRHVGAWRVVSPGSSYQLVSISNSCWPPWAGRCCMPTVNGVIWMSRYCFRKTWLFISRSLLGLESVSTPHGLLLSTLTLQFISDLITRLNKRVIYAKRFYIIDTLALLTNTTASQVYKSNNSVIKSLSINEHDRKSLRQRQLTFWKPCVYDLFVDYKVRYWLCNQLISYIHEDINTEWLKWTDVLFSEIYSSYMTTPAVSHLTVATWVVLLSW